MLKIILLVTLAAAVAAEINIPVAVTLEVPESGEAFKEPDAERNGRVIYGQQAINGQFPWTVRVSLNSGHLCTGSIIASNYILSARHCFHGLGATQVQIGAGSIDRYSMTYRYANGVWYLSGENPPDIAIFRLSQHFTFNSYIQAVQLPRLSQESAQFLGSKATIIGWGGALGGLPRYLQYGIFGIRTDCSFQDFVICSSGDSNAHAQGGDSGGPMVIYENGIPTLIGINVFITSNRLVGSTKVAKFLYVMNEYTKIPLRV